MNDARDQRMARACRRITIIQGHPDPKGGHYCHALAAAYEEGARAAGHEVHIIDVAAHVVPFVSCRGDLETETAPPVIFLAQRTMVDSDHILLIHPVWNGGAPARLRAFMESAFRPAFIFPDLKIGEHLGFSSAFTQRKALKGKTARVVATMQMPGFVYRWYFRPHQEASALRLGGAAVRESLIGRVETKDGENRQRWLRRMTAFGAEAC